jgi:4-amino-4-deoxy-L-arabinose transferase-like glycosyltransferase
MTAGGLPRWWAGLEVRRLMLVVFIAAIVFRVALYFSGLVDVVYMTADSSQYHDQALSLATTGTFSEGGQPSMNRTPGYPGLVALVYLLFGPSRLGVTALQMVLDALTCVLVVHLGIRAGLRRGALAVVAVLATTCAYSSVYTYQLMTETAYTFALTLAIWVWTGAQGPREPLDTSPTRALLAGMLLGYATLVRPAMLVSAFVFGILLGALLLVRTRLAVLRRPRLAMVPLAYGLGVLLCVVPWMIRNRLVFPDEYRQPDNDRVTALGLKSPVRSADHLYKREFNRFWASYEQPYVQLSPAAPPVVARYVYPEEPEDVYAAFARLQDDVRNTGSYRPESLPAFARITQKRYRAAPRLHVTAPATLVAKLWVTPRISVLFANRAGHNSRMALVLGLTVYSSIYLLGLLGIVWGLRLKARMVAVYLSAMVIGHTFIYALWLPIPQARYTVVVYPLLSLGAGALLDHLLARKETLSKGRVRRLEGGAEQGALARSAPES